MNAQESKIERVFYTALEKSSSAERAAYLDESCADDPELRGRVQRLLDAQPKVGRFLEHDGLSVAPTIGQPVGERLGTMIGRYKLLQEIGEGGMGAVYMAEQTEPIRRQVALKIIKLGMDTKQVVARFEAERQALAVMDHPNIAKVHDAGATDSGRPYFVMELIRGLPITEHCDQNNLTTKARIELFIDVCHAVQHAHLEGVIHRDLKPSNVIVTLVDGRPVPKVIDFGIAKATQKRLTEKTSLTGDGQFLGTPQYMSPEQAGMSDLHVDIRTDIYSLGVVLYELLVGRTPFDPEQLRQAGYDEVYRIIRETDPPTPSKQLSTLGAAAEETSRQRQVQLKVLWRLLHGDLDCIVMKTLEKARDDRYATADALADDLQRFLDDKPIEAKRPTPVARVAKWSRRHGWGVATSIAATFGILLTVAVVMWFGQRREAIQRERAEENVRLAFNAMEQIYLEFVDGPPFNPLAKGLDDQLFISPKRAEYLRKSLEFYEQFTRANHGVRAVRREVAEAYNRLGDIHSQLGDHRKAELVFHKAVEMVKELLRESPAELDNRRCLIKVHIDQGTAFALKGDLDRAVMEFDEAIRLDPTNADAYGSRGVWNRYKGDLDNAIADLTTAIRLDPKKSAYFGVRGMAYNDKGDSDQGIADFEEAIRLDSRNSSAYNNLGFVHTQQGNLDDAVRTLSDAIRVAPDYIIAYLNRGDAYIKAGAFEKAVDDFKAAVQLDPQFRSPYLKLGIAYEKMGDLDKAVDAFSTAIRLDPDYFDAYMYRGSVYRKQDKPEQGIADFTEGIRLAPEHTSAYRSRGDAYFGDGNFEQAIADYTKAIRLDPQHSNTYNSLGVAYFKKGDIQQALATFSQIIRVDPRGGAAYCNRGGVYLATGDIERAITDFDEAIRIRPEHTPAYSLRGGIYIEQGHVEKGLADLAKAIELDADEASNSWRYALALLISGNMDAYRSECARMLARFSPAEDVDKGYCTAWTCALAPQAVDDLSIAAKLAEKAVQADPKSAKCVKTLGAVLYRAGQIDAAIKRLCEADRLQQTSDSSARSSPAFIWYFLAMAHHADGRHDEANQWLNKAVEWTDDRIRTNKQKDGSRLTWNRRSTLILLREEAEALLASSPN